jgi:hypothetical protein
MDELNMPQLFIIVPVDTKVWNGGLKCDPTALYMNTVKLIFICEHSFHTCGEGFTIKQPKEFIKRWGPAIQTSLWALQLAVKVASTCAGIPLPKIPQLDGLDASSSLAFLNNVSTLLSTYMLYTDSSNGLYVVRTTVYMYGVACTLLI